MTSEELKEALSKKYKPAIVESVKPFVASTNDDYDTSTRTLYVGKIVTTESESFDLMFTKPGTLLTLFFKGYVATFDRNIPELKH